MRKCRSFIQMRAALRARLVVGDAREPGGEVGAQLGGAAERAVEVAAITASRTPALRPRWRASSGAVPQMSTRRSRSGGFASISEKICTPEGRRGEEGVERGERRRRGSRCRRCGAGARARAGGRSRGRARCGSAGRRAQAAHAVARRPSGSAKIASGAGAAAGARPGTKKGSVSAWTVAKRAASVGGRRPAASVAAEGGEAGEARLGCSGMRWVWASSSICRRCSSVAVGDVGVRRGSSAASRVDPALARRGRRARRGWRAGGARGRGRR